MCSDTDWKHWSDLARLLQIDADNCSTDRRNLDVLRDIYFTVPVRGITLSLV